MKTAVFWVNLDKVGLDEGDDVKSLDVIGSELLAGEVSAKFHFFPGFEAFKVKSSTGIHINGVKGGSGPPVLLIHVAPCNLVNWRNVAPVEYWTEQELICGI